MKTIALLSAVCLLLLVVGAVAGRANRGADENTSSDDSRPCPISFENFDFSPLTSSCNPSAMTVESCCRQFDSIFQPYLEEMADNVACAEEVFSRMEARGYKALAFDALCLGGGRRETQAVQPVVQAVASAPASDTNSAFATGAPTLLQLALSMGAFLAVF